MYLTHEDNFNFLLISLVKCNVYDTKKIPSVLDPSFYRNVFIAPSWVYSKSNRSNFQIGVCDDKILKGALVTVIVN